MEPQPTAAAIYCRISSDRAGEGLGVARQETLCQDLADRKGWTVAEVYVDNDRGAYIGKSRPEYQRMLADLKDGTRDGVLVVDTDRLTRHPRELEDFVDLADRRGIALANVSGDLDLSTSDGRFRARIMGAVARQESEKKAERIQRQREQMARAGRPHPNRRAFGWKKGNAEHEPAEAAMIQQAALDVLAGRSVRSIAERWNAEGVTTAYGNRWTTGAVTDVLTRPANAGLRVHRGEIIGEGAWQPIIARDVWERLVAQARQRSRPGRPPRHLLTGILTCGHCGAGLYGNVSKGRRVYQCRRNPADDACGRLSINADGADAEIRDQVIAALASPTLQAALRDAEQPSDDGGLAAQLAEDEQRLDQLATDHYADGIIGRREYLAARERIETRMQRAQSRLGARSRTAVLDDLPADTEELRAWWASAEVDTRRALLRVVVERIVLLPRKDGAPRRFDPTRLRVEWRV